MPDVFVASKYRISLQIGASVIQGNWIPPVRPGDNASVEANKQARAQLVGGYKISKCDSRDWLAWYAVNKDNQFCTMELIHGDPDRAALEAWCKEAGRRVKTGMAPIQVA